MTEWISAIFNGWSSFEVVLCLAAVIIVVGFLYTCKNTRRTNSQPDRTTKVYEIYRAIEENRLYKFLEEIDRGHKRNQAASEEQRLINITNLLMWWTAVLAGATLLAALFAGFTLSAIRGQLEEMQKAGSDTRDLARAAQEQAATAKHTEEAQLRAYIGTDEVILTCRPCDEFVKIARAAPTENIVPQIGANETNRLLLSMHNFGRTPAYKVLPHISFAVLPPYQPLPDDFSYPDKPSPQIRSVIPTEGAFFIGADEKRRYNYIPDAEALAGIANAGIGRATVYVYGHIEYEDVFKTIHHRLFVFLYNGRTNGFVAIGPRNGEHD